MLYKKSCFFVKINRLDVRNRCFVKTFLIYNYHLDYVPIIPDSFSQRHKNISDRRFFPARKL